MWPQISSPSPNADLSRRYSSSASLLYSLPSAQDTTGSWSGRLESAQDVQAARVWFALSACSACVSCLIQHKGIGGRLWGETDLGLVAHELAAMRDAASVVTHGG
jgi:hypothetical protein